MRRAFDATVAGALCVALIPAIAIAGKKVPSEVSLTNQASGQYSGEVTAKDSKCRKGRTVNVWHDTNGNGRIDGEPTDFKIGTATTDDKGQYDVTGNQAPAGDNIIAEVAQRRVGKGKKKKTCLGTTKVATAGPTS